MTEYLSLEDLLGLVRDLGVGPVRDVGLLDSAAHRPQSVVFGTEVYPTLHDKAAVLLHSIVGNHPLVDGNKRLGWLAVVVFYGVNDIRLDVTDDDAAYELVIAVATGELEPATIAERLASW
ncbi:MAG: type II toxin-antitoxin system death-on-curing family toxin, partial [Dermatophilaceae bacterium]